MFYVKNLIDFQCDEISFVDLLAHCEYYPAIFQILNIFISLPPTTYTIERSFSTLRRVKTWLRSTTGEDRLNGLCMMSLHRERFNANKDTFIQDVINMFGIKRSSYLLIPNNILSILFNFYFFIYLLKLLIIYLFIRMAIIIYLFIYLYGNYSVQNLI